MVKRWFVRFTIVGTLVSGASCLISVKDYQLRGAAGGSETPGPWSERLLADGAVLDRPIFGSYSVLAVDLLGE
ncbi:MAG TPA: hypothetical protein VIK01_21580 [Polyangiaceae bacterium]